MTLLPTSLSLTTALAVACGSTPAERPSTVGAETVAAADTASPTDNDLAPTDVLLAGGLVTAEGRSFTIDNGRFAGFEVTIAPGAFSEAGVFAVLAVRAEWDPNGTIPLLQLAANVDFDPHGVTIQVPHVPSALGLPAHGARVYAIGSAGGRWVDLGPVDGKADAASVWTSVKASLGAVADQAKADAKAGVAAIVATGNWAADQMQAVTDAITAGATAVVVFYADAFKDTYDDVLKAASKAKYYIAIGDKQLHRLLLQPPELSAYDLPGQPTNRKLGDVICADGNRVLVFHGVLSHYDEFSGERDLLKGFARGGWSVAKAAYPSGHAITINGLIMAAILRAAHATCPERSGPDAVGHSMGGLVLRSMVQEHGGRPDLRRVVMLSSPNAGSHVTGFLPDTTDLDALKWYELLMLAASPGSELLITIQALMPGLTADLLVGSSRLSAEHLGNPAAVGDVADRYFVVTGWSSRKGFSLGGGTIDIDTDSLVAIDSALSLDLPNGHEFYMAKVDGADTAIPWEGASGGPHDGEPAKHFEHGPIHVEAASNGVLEKVMALLTVTCHSACAHKECGESCGQSCGSCGLGSVCSSEGQCDVCTPLCIGKVCEEDDGCGKPCISGSGCSATPFSDPGDTTTIEVLVSVPEIDASADGHVKLYVSVQTQSGEPLGELTPGNFALQETVNGVSASVPVDTVEIAEESDSALRAVLVIDSSGSMSEMEAPTALELAKNAAKNFVSHIKATDQVAIVDFASTVVVRQTLTDDKTALFAAIDAVGLHEATAMFDGIDAGLSLLTGATGQKALIVITDGQDNSSLVSQNEVVARALALKVPIYGVGLAIDPTGGYEDVLVSLSTATNAGGMGIGYFDAPTASLLAELYEKISLILKKTYVVGWYTTGKKGDAVTLALTVSYEAFAGKLSDSFQSSYFVP